MRFYEDLLIDGRPVVAPDAGLEMQMTDLDTQESGRDESGFMHRVILRKDVRTFILQYAFLTLEEYQYMKKLICPAGGTFTLSFRDEWGKQATTKAYCSNHTVSVQDGKKGLYRNLKFHIIEC